jgi:hypothetical protein
MWEQKGPAVESGQTLFRLFMFDRWLDAFHVPVEAESLRRAA